MQKKMKMPFGFEKFFDIYFFFFPIWSNIKHELLIKCEYICQAFSGKQNGKRETNIEIFFINMKESHDLNFSKHEKKLYIVGVLF